MKTEGFTLIELIIFIVVVGLLAAGILLAFNNILAKSVTPHDQNLAVQLAKERMEIILGQRWAVGFAGFSDPCDPGPGPALCSALPSGFAVASTITTLADPNFKSITVDVTGSSSATLNARVSNYSNE